MSPVSPEAGASPEPQRDRLAAHYRRIGISALAAATRRPRDDKPGAAPQRREIIHVD